MANPIVAVTEVADAFATVLDEVEKGESVASNPNAQAQLAKGLGAFIDYAVVALGATAATAIGGGPEDGIGTAFGAVTASLLAVSPKVSEFSDATGQLVASGLIAFLSGLQEGASYLGVTSTATIGPMTVTAQQSSNGTMTVTATPTNPTIGSSGSDLTITLSPTSGNQGKSISATVAGPSGQGTVQGTVTTTPGGPTGGTFQFDAPPVPNEPSSNVAVNLVAPISATGDAAYGTVTPSAGPQLSFSQADGQIAITAGSDAFSLPTDNLPILGVGSDSAFLAGLSSATEDANQSVEVSAISGGSSTLSGNDLTILGAQDVGIGAVPSNLYGGIYFQESVQRLKDRVSAILVPGNMGPWEEVRDTLNRLLRGWCGYFSPGSHHATDRVIETHLYDHVRNFLVRRHKLPTRGSRQIRADAVFGTLGVPRLRMCRRTGAIS